jgi:hypothetical protein
MVEVMHNVLLNVTKVTFATSAFIGIFTTLALGSQLRQWVARLQVKRKTWESHHMFTGVPKSVRE